MGEARELSGGRRQLKDKSEEAIIHQGSVREVTRIYEELLLLSQRANLIPWQASSAKQKEKWGMKQKASRIIRNVQGLTGTSEDKSVWSHCLEL